ncbi:MAG: hypothetical protein PHS00_02165 [Candidatus Pacebacteria bacterium]|nr:hypothetical protein [Candidatus Paceibacterota bacterium]
MNKEKTLIFSLSAMLFLTASFLVYSWNEPTGTMPGNYSIPLNTSGNAQTKYGDLSATSFIDANDPNYYLNPSNNSKIYSISSDLSIEDIDNRDTKTLVTKEYLDFSLSELDQTITQTSNMFYVSGGLNPTCPEGTTLFEKKWLPKTCSGTFYLTACGSAPCYANATSNGGWTRDLDNVPNSTAYSGTCSANYYCSTTASPCYSNSWEAVICYKNNYNDGTPLLVNGKHTSKECTDSEGTVIEVAPNVKICQFSGSVCPTNTLMWRQYENWSTTIPGSCYCGRQCYTTCPGAIFEHHSWSNTPPEIYYHVQGANRINMCGTSINGSTINCYYPYDDYQIYTLTSAIRTHVGCY